MSDITPDINIVPAIQPTVPVADLWAKGLQDTQSHIRSGTTVQVAKSQMKSMMQSQVFQYCSAVVLVFVTSFAILVFMKPSFTYTQPDDKHEVERFSAGKTALFALSATLIAIIVTVVVMMTKSSA